MCFFEETQSGSSRDPVGTQSGPNRAPILAFLGTAFGQSGSSRDPVGHQFSNFLHHVWTCREAAKSPKNAQKHCKNAVFCAFGCLPTLVPDWIPTGQKRCPKMQKLVPDWVPTIPTGSIDRQAAKAVLKPNGGSTTYIPDFSLFHSISMALTFIFNMLQPVFGCHDAVPRYHVGQGFCGTSKSASWKRTLPLGVPGFSFQAFVTWGIGCGRAL